MPEVESAVLSRGRRSTAGRRMGVLVGEALENDDAFWGHSTWMDDEDKRKSRQKGSSNNDDDTSSEISSADESFDLNEEPEENRVDVFDSDFDESESEESSGSDNEQAVLREEKQSKRAATASKRKSAKLSVFSRKRKASVINRKKLMGSEHNAGLVLKLPSVITDNADAIVAKNASSMPPPAATMASNMRKNVVEPIKKVSTLAATRSRRVGATKTSERATHNNTDTTATATSSTKKKASARKRKFTQEELLIESIRETEPTNERWLLGRRRVEAMSNLDDKRKAERIAANGNRDAKVVMKYHSLKGCYNTITFPDMDHVPQIFRRKTATDINEDSMTTAKLKNKKNNDECIITGKKARYRDPLTGESYYDLKAYRELRRRYNEGLPLNLPTDYHRNHDVDHDQSSVGSESSNNNVESNRSDSSLSGQDNICIEDETNLTTHSLPDTSPQHYSCSLGHNNETHELNSEEYPTNTNHTYFSTTDYDIGNSDDIDIDTLFQNDPNNKSNAPSNHLSHDNNIATITEINDNSNNEFISSIVTPPQTFNNNENDFVSNATSAASSSKVISSSKRSFDEDKKKSSTSSTTQQVIIAS